MKTVGASTSADRPRGSSRGREALRRFVTELRAEHGDAANRRGKGNIGSPRTRGRSR